MTRPHFCKATGNSAAIDRCYEDFDGQYIVSNGEYASRVAYCPMCGEKAPGVDLDPPAAGEALLRELSERWYLPRDAFPPRVVVAAEKGLVAVSGVPKDWCDWGEWAAPWYSVHGPRTVDDLVRRYEDPLRRIFPSGLKVWCT